MTEFAAPHLPVAFLAAPHPHTPIGVVVRQPACPTCRTLPRPTFSSAATQPANGRKKLCAYETDSQT